MLLSYSLSCKRFLGICWLNKLDLSEIVSVWTMADTLSGMSKLFAHISLEITQHPLVR